MLENIKLKCLIYIKKNFTINNYIKELIEFIERSKFFEINWNSFITLTYGEDQKYSIKNIKKVEKVLEKKKIKYFWVIECGKKNNIHVHMIVDQYIEVKEVKEIWSKIVNNEKNIVDIRKIENIENLFYYLIKDLNIKKINEIKKVLEKEKLIIWNSNLEYKKKLNEKKLIEYEIELENLLKFETFLTYKDNEKYNWIFLISERLANIIIKKIYNEKNIEKKVIYEKLLKDETFFNQLTKTFILYIISLGTEKEYSLILFLETLSITFLSIYPILNTAFGSRSLGIKRLNEVESVNIKKYLFIGNGLITLYENYLTEYIIFKKIINTEENLPKQMIKFVYNKNFEDFLKKENLDKNYNSLVKGFLGYKYLMVIPPIDWVYKNKNYEGGYLNNKFPLVITEGHGHKLKISKFVLENLNYLQKCSLKLNDELLNFLYKNAKKILNFLRTNENLEDKINKLNLKYKNLWKEIYNNLNNKNEIKEFFKSLKGSEMQKNLMIVEGELNSCREKYADYLLFNKLIYNENLIIKNSNVLTKYEEIDEVYIPYNLDFRGRVYPLNTDLNFHASKLARVLFLACEERIFDYKIFKIYSVRCYYKENYNDEKSINLFDEFLYEKMLKFNDDAVFDSFVLTASNLFAFINCCIELKKYINFLEMQRRNLIKLDEKYYSNFLISLDATCSGSQILSVLLKDMQFFKALNLKDDSQINDFYITFIDEYKKSKFFYKISKYWRGSVFELLSFNELRTFFKNIIMTFNYGLTYIGFLEKFRKNYITSCVLKKFTIDYEICNEIAKSFWKYSREIRFMLLHTVFSELVEIYGKFGLDIEWFTPINTKIMQKYFVEKSVKLDVRINKLRNIVKDKKMLDSHFLKKITVKVKDFNKLNYRKGSLALTANYIHSLDSSLLFFVINEFKKKNYFIACVHDCFFVHTSNVDLILNSYKKGLIDLFLKTNLLDEFLIEINNNLLRILETKKNDKDLKLKINKIISEINNLKIKVTEKHLFEMIKNVEKSKYALIISD